MLAVVGRAQPAAATAAPAPQDYGAAIAKLYSAEGIQDFIAKSDQLVDAVDSESGVSGVAHLDTKSGLRMDATSQKTEEAILYYYSLSRGGAELHYSEAVKLIALFADRFGLPHPVNVTSGENDIYYAQWLFKPSDMKKLRKLMLQVREKSRAEKNPLKAFALAVQRELDSRAAAHPADR